MNTKVKEITVSYQGGGNTKSDYKIHSSKDAAKLLFEQWDKNTIAVQEAFKVVMLNNAHKVKGIYQLSTGGITGTLVDLRILFAVALKSLTTAMILAHSHPSGTLTPSEADKKITYKIKRASEFLDIKLLDHIIIIPNGDYYSFADNGIL